MYNYNKKSDGIKVIALIAIIIGVCSIMCNIRQNCFYQKTIKSYEKELNTLNAEYIKSENIINEMKEQYRLLEDQYNELYYSGK